MYPPAAVIRELSAAQCSVGAYQRMRYDGLTLVLGFMIVAEWLGITFNADY